jgi:hypothetical protein
MTDFFILNVEWVRICPPDDISCNNNSDNNNIDVIDNSSNYINIITNNSNKKDISNEYVYIKIQHNPLKFNRYAAFVKFIQPNKPNNYYKLVNKNLYYVNIDNEGYMFNDELSNIDIPNGTILPIKIFQQEDFTTGCNKLI